MKFFQALLLLACAGRLDSLLSSTAAFVKRNKTLRNRCYSSSDKILKPFRRSFETKGFDSSATPTGVILPRDSSQRSLEEEKFPDEEYEDDTDFRRGNYLLLSKLILVPVFRNRCITTSGFDLEEWKALHN